MDALHRLAESGAAAGTAVVAAEQTAGRGSRGRRWQSPRGGLWLSVLLRPAKEATELLSLRAGLAVAGALERAHPQIELRIKWPNDLFWRDRKVGGVLCEARWSGESPAWTVVGVGLNLRNPVPEALAGGAASLGELLPDLTAEDVLDLVLPRLRGLDASAPRLGPSELDELARRDWLRGRCLAEPVAGVAEGIAPDGSLLVRTPDGRAAELRAGTVRVAEPGVSP
jgi:BirA family biotin operon repressor/biotin-[acetyl-CoA-carboxylase] ligase